MIRPVLVLGLVALFLQGCETLPSWEFWPLEKKSPSRTSEAERVLAEEQPKSAPNLSEAPVPKPEPKPAPAKVQQQAVAEVAEDPPPAVKTLVGLDFTGVRDLLGDPALEEIVAPATVWAYSGRGCVLNIFFYPHVDGGEFRALTYRAAGADQTEETAQQCFAELISDQNRPTETN